MHFNGLTHDSAELLELLYQHKVLVIRRPELTTQGFIDLAKSWGELIAFVDESFHHPNHPEIFVVSNRKNDEGKKLGMDRVGHYWHSDGSFLKRPQPISLLWCQRAALSGGETEFLDMGKVLEEMDPQMRAQLEGSHAVHDGLGKYIISENDLGLSIEEIIRRDRQLCPPVVHPAVISHPKTGKRSLYINPGFTSALLGGDPDLLEVVIEKLISPQDSYKHNWEQGDLVIWDNRSVIHRAYPAESGEREMFRLGVRDGEFYV